MDWKEIYKSRLKTAEEAVSLIKSGDRVVLAHAASEPAYLTEKMAEDYKRLQNVEVVQLVALSPSSYSKPEMVGHFRFNSQFVGGSNRRAISGKYGDFTPCFFFMAPQLMREKMIPDVSMISVSPPDKNGYCSFGVSCDYARTIVDHGKLVIAQVNKHLPRVLGDNFVHVSELDVIVEHDEPIPAVPGAKIGAVEEAIGKHCASLIQDGDTLQLGIGAIPDAVLLFLKDKKDLGIHSEMFSDGVVELVEAGVITGKRKNLHKGKLVVTFLFGTKRLYDFVDNNPMVQMMPVDYVNDPRVIGQNDNLISINSAMEVDLYGQVCAEAMGKNQFSGIGGQLDFVRGAAFSKGGKSIIAFPSTAKNDTISKIVPWLTEGTPVTTTRVDVDYVVTEYGLAKLKFNSLRERARQLINIAHPAFREALKAEFKERFREDF
ncbi:MAG: 4-hydroxybutyrate CoA-transferase [Fusobacteriaceae bacterium]|jgi:4-hydroxybutyrate CoA-transferase|nr:4-hydroxybutyrate CoA-transferase [Fusobacteriaceae bacterium]